MLTESPERSLIEFSSVSWWESTLFTTFPGSKQGCSLTREYCAWLCPLFFPHCWMSLAFPLVPYPLPHSCLHALCQLLPFRQLRVKAEVANCLREEDLEWEEILLQIKPRRYISKCPRFLFLLGCFFSIVLMTKRVNYLCSFNMITNKHFWGKQC